MARWLFTENQWAHSWLISCLHLPLKVSIWLRQHLIPNFSLYSLPRHPRLSVTTQLPFKPQITMIYPLTLRCHLQSRDNRQWCTRHHQSSLLLQLEYLYKIIVLQHHLLSKQNNYTRLKVNPSKVLFKNIIIWSLVPIKWE